MKQPVTLGLWEKFIKGDDNALSSLYSIYVHQLYSYGLKICGDDHLVKDCIQEVFIHLIDKRKTLKASDSTSVYLFKSLRNKLLEELRSKNRRSRITNSISFETDKHDISIEQIKVQSEEKERRSMIIAKALDRLSDYQIEAVFLKYSQGFDYEKIGEMLGIDVASARTLIYRSLKKIKESISMSSKIFLFFLHL